MDSSVNQIKEQTKGWFTESETPNWFHRQIIAILKCGPVPRHIGIIMDGNRRFAKQNHMERQQGHMKGFDKLTETLQWCLDLGINEVTVYAFSLENFKRSNTEVDGLMNLFRAKINQLIEEREKLEEHGVCVRILGNISLLPDDLQLLVKEAVAMSSSYNRAFLNVCIAYTSREEITQSIQQVAEGVASGLLEESDVDTELLNSCMYTAPCQPLDMILRTSGEVRLSDFLLWQSTYSVLSFVKVLWPEFCRWDLYAAVMYYQRSVSLIQKVKAEHMKSLDSHSSVSVGHSEAESKERRQAFLQTSKRTPTVTAS